MDLGQLRDLMATDIDGRHKQTEEQAIALRDLLVRDHAGQDTVDIDGSHWMTLCCAVDPTEQPLGADRRTLARVLGVPESEISDAALADLTFGPTDDAVRERWATKPWKQ